MKLSWSVSKLQSGHDFYMENYKVYNSATNVSGVTVVYLCTLPGHAL